MSRWSHALYDIDRSKMTAKCSICGPTRIYFPPDGYATCSTYRRQDEEDRFNRSRMRLVIDALGKECEFCGFRDWRALQVDHKSGTGGKRRSIHLIYNDILDGFGDDYQLLCANCNAIKASERNERSGCYDSLP